MTRFLVSTWNCFGMGQGLDAVTYFRAPYPDRFRDVDVLAACASPDVLCVQELLSRDAQRFFDGLARAPQESPLSRFRDHNQVQLRTRTARGSGLGVSSRLPLLETVVHPFGGQPVGWDRLARKGALAARVQVDGVPVDLVNTHLQAGYDPFATAVRQKQLAELRELVDRHGSPDRPLIVCGDFNIDGLAAARGNAEYLALARTMAGFEDAGGAADLATYDPTAEGNQLARVFEPDSPPQRVDYIFWRPARVGPTLRCTSVTRFLDRPLLHTKLRGQAGWASDHFGLTATFVLGA